ncbi:ABC1 kinase family protein [Casimicrobium huifangae]|uniref:ABC1 kinase family protein n=1 Tax=Casimicrobium huifangae TaxID=2591109 RepID=UPI0012EBFD55|nr:AarF/UbiB family protein [Casimicrobium huifangae]
MLLETLDTARDLGRLNEIAGVLLRHGFGDAVRRLGLADRLQRAGHVLNWEHAADLARIEPPVQVRRLGLADRLQRAGHVLNWEHAADLARIEPPVQVRLAMEELGPTFVKLGQVLAGRADLFGPEWIAEFEKLHSHVPALPLDALRPQLLEDLGAEPEAVFARFEIEPLAAASIAQVHRAALADGTEVIVKIRRPGIETTIESDLRLLARLAAMADAQMPALRPYRPQQLVRELARSLKRELDLAAECHNAERMAKNLAALPDIVIPRVHWAYTKKRINVQDFIVGVAGSDLARLDAEGFDRTLLAKRGAHAVLKMIVEDGFFHADPHPGNVFYLPVNRVAFIDFGMVGRLSERRREELLQLLLGLVERQPQAVADVLMDWTGDDHGLNLSLMETEIEAFVDQYHDTPLASLSLGGMLGDVTAILREHHLALPSDLALLIKAFISLEGMGRGLDPNFHMASEALPLLRQVVRARYQPNVMARRGWQTIRRALAVAEQLPHDMSKLLRTARRGRLNVGLELIHLKRVGDQIDRAANRMAVALVIAALIIGSSIVMTVSGGPTLFGLPAFGFLGFCAAVVGGIWLLRSIWRSNRADRDDDV